VDVPLLLKECWKEGNELGSELFSKERKLSPGIKAFDGARISST
jgi:hypothetical protein